MLQVPVQGFTKTFHLLRKDSARARREYQALYESMDARKLPKYGELTTQSIKRTFGCRGLRANSHARRQCSLAQLPRDLKEVPPAEELHLQAGLALRIVKVQIKGLGFWVFG